MEKTFKIIENCLNTVMGVNILDNQPNHISGSLKTLFCVAFLTFTIWLEFYFLAFDLTKNSVEKFLLYCNLPGTVVILIQVLRFLNNKVKYCELVDWVRGRYLRRPQSKMVDDLSKLYFQECSNFINKISV